MVSTSRSDLPSTHMAVQSYLRRTPFKFRSSSIVPENEHAPPDCSNTVELAGILRTGCSACRVFKTFRSVANSSTLRDTIQVTDDFPVGSLQISRVLSSQPGRMSLLHSRAGAGPVTTLLLKPSAEKTGLYEPEGTYDGTSRGQWTLTITDNLPDADQRLISLASWTLQLCSQDMSALVTAAQGPSSGPLPLPPLPVMPNISVSISPTGVSVNFTNGTIGVNTAEGRLSVRVAKADLA